MRRPGARPEDKPAGRKGRPVEGLLRLESGWWVMVGAHVDTDHGPTVTLVMQFDPNDELPSCGVKPVRFSPEEAEQLAESVSKALATLKAH